MALMNTRWNTLDRDFDRMPTTFSDALDDFFNRALSAGPTGGWTPDLNVSETDDQFEITVELPGMKKEDIDIGLEDHVLHISGERSIGQEDSGKKYRRIESSYGAFKRSLPLPEAIDTDSVEASYENGVLYITIDKEETKATKQIEVK